MLYVQQGLLLLFMNNYGRVLFQDNTQETPLHLFWYCELAQECWHSRSIFDESLLASQSAAPQEVDTHL